MNRCLSCIDRGRGIAQMPRCKRSSCSVNTRNKRGRIGRGRMISESTVSCPLVIFESIGSCWSAIDVVAEGNTPPTRLHLGKDRNGLHRAIEFWTVLSLRATAQAAVATYRIVARRVWYVSNVSRPFSLLEVEILRCLVPGTGRALGGVAWVACGTLRTGRSVSPRP